MEVHNRDVFPTEDTIKLYPLIKPLVVNPIIDAEFTRREDAANAAKKMYHSRGKLAARLVALSATYSVADALILGPFPGDFIVGYLAVLLAGVGIYLQLYILKTRQKEKWLLNRFAAERLRSLKFQSYALAEQVSATDALERAVAQFSRSAKVSVDDDVNAGFSRLEKFEPEEALQPHGSSGTATNAEILSQARDAYTRLRIKYQQRFAQSELLRLGEDQRVGNTSADILYLLGAGATLVALIARIIPAAPHELIAWIDFLAIAVFIQAASQSMLENASLAAQSRTRYEQYARDVEKIESDHGTSGHSIASIVKRMELLAMTELDDFCRSATKISYRL